MFFCLLAFGGMGGMGYYYLSQISFTLQLSGNMDDLSADVTEARRIERHYAKYGLEEDHQEVLALVDQAMEKLHSILAHVHDNPRLKVSLQDKQLLHTLHTCLETYKAYLADLPATPQGKDEQASPVGARVGESTRKMVLQLRDDIIVMVGLLQKQLFGAMLLLLSLTLTGGWLSVKRILKALDIIEDATRSIVKGNFTALPVPHTEEETGQVIHAINHMVGELEHKQHHLEQERKLASLGVLTAGVAHQLNNPLNNIFSTCQLLHEAAHEAATGLRSAPSLTEVEKKMDIVLQETRRSRRIIRGLLDFSRESTCNALPCSLAEVTRNALALASAHIPECTQIHVDIAEDILLPLDAQRFQEACINLFINAGEALTQGPGEIRVRAHATEDAVLLEIEDTGEGIAKEKIPNIFDPFFTGKSMGTGLGLSVAFGIIRKHEGSISVESTPGVKTTFTIRLPRQRSAVQEMHV